MRYVEKEPNKLVKISSSENTSIPLLLWVQLKQIEESHTAVKVTIEANVNPMMQAMVKKPLQQFADMLVTQMEGFGF
ncbi:MAG: hypothetical protein HC896_17195 [Bacteroidales bacterium]|nr:hypothetical protein [Bacteroidales bacterium]